MLFGLDIGGFFTSTEFISQLAAFISALLGAIASGVVQTVFGVSGG